MKWNKIMLFLSVIMIPLALAGSEQYVFKTDLNTLECEIDSCGAMSEDLPGIYFWIYGAYSLKDPSNNVVYQSEVIELCESGGVWNPELEWTVDQEGLWKFGARMVVYYYDFTTLECSFNEWCSDEGFDTYEYSVCQVEDYTEQIDQDFDSWIDTW